MIGGATVSLINIKPCPFCGRMPTVEHDLHICDGEEYATVRCHCGVWLQGFGYGKTEEESINDAIRKWNTRAYQDEPALLTKVKSLIDHLEREADSAEVAYVHYGDAEDRAEHCAYKDAARRLREIAEGKSDA